ncbi:LCP family protein [Alkaliphilus crotonatoxidans]
MRKIRKRFWLLIFLGAIFFIGAGAMTNLLMAGGFNGSGGGILNPLNIFGNRKERINILVFGIDADNPEKVEKRRSDTIMLLSVDGAGKNPVLLSIPRDTRVPISGRSSQEKINHSHAYGGPELLLETVEGLLGIEIDYYVRINYHAVEEVVDALGGVEIDVPMNMKYDDPYDDPPLHINIKKGLQVLDGKNAVHFLRFRKGYANQDLGRIEAQQQFVQALKDKVLSPSVIPKIPQLIDIFYSNVDTDLPKTKMLSLGTKLAGFNNEEMIKLTLPGTSKYIGNVSYYVADEAEVRNMRNSYLVGEIEKGFDVTVLNGCGVSGIAAKYQGLLEKEGIQVSSIDNYESSNVASSFIEYPKGFEKQAKKVASLFKIKDLREKETPSDSTIRLIVGSDLAN